jgi:crossover junction endonuclease MUS81
MSNFLDLTDDVSDLDEPAGGSASGWQRQSTPEIRAPHQENSTFPSSVTATDLITLPHGSFTVELVLDNREVRTVTDRDYISNELIKKGITPIVRSLELGDSMWVAKCKDPTFLSRYGEEGDEVVLDWIVERKRVDDLVGSIKDGRFYEQKFRLRRSGVRNVIYLIEEFAITETYGPGVRFQDSIESAIASTQVVNDYFVKRTRNLDDTIRYLARMTSLLRDMYTGSASSTSQTSISIVPTRTIDSVETYLQLLNRFRVDEGPRSGSRTYSTTFTTFSSLSSKSDMLTLRDVFLKMLMCTRGVTGTKAIEIQRRWSTPRDFIEAFESMAEKNPGNKAAVEDMVASRLSGLVGPKKMGRALSQKISQVWGPHS